MYMTNDPTELRFPSINTVRLHMHERPVLIRIKTEQSSQQMEGKMCSGLIETGRRSSTVFVALIDHHSVTLRYSPP